MADVKDYIRELVTKNPVMLFMKGNRHFPQCGFSARAVEILRRCDARFETFDVLSDPSVRDGIKTYANWPTIPQLYINGEFIGGSDIMMEMYESGELKQALANPQATPAT